MPRDILSEQQSNIEFVKNVQKFPCLYNYELPSYTRKDISDKAWEEVADAMNMTPSACRERWRNLRAVFMRTIKATGSGTKKKPYYLADVMHFIVPFLRPTTMSEAEKQRIISLEITRAEQARAKVAEKPPLKVELEEIKVEHMDEDDTSQSVPEWAVDNSVTSLKRPSDSEDYNPTPIKRQPQPVHPAPVALPEPSDPVLSFAYSLMPELREMNSAQFKSFKRRVLVLIDDITNEIPSTPRGDTDYSIQTL